VRRWCKPRPLRIEGTLLPLLRTHQFWSLACRKRTIPAYVQHATRLQLFCKIPSEISCRRKNCLYLRGRRRAPNRSLLRVRATAGERPEFSSPASGPRAEESLPRMMRGAAPGSGRRPAPRRRSLEASSGALALEDQICAFTRGPSTASASVLSLRNARSAASASKTLVIVRANKHQAANGISTR
jgi:hypothetical protein